MSPNREPQQNHFFRTLPAEVRERMLPHLELVPMPLGRVLYDAGDIVGSIYFPTDSIVSLLYTMGSRFSTALTGCDGVVGIALFMGGEPTPHRAIVQTAGHAYRLNGHLLKEEFNRSEALRHLLLRYTHTLLTQMAQTAVCSRHHSVDQQLCRWLLLSLDRLMADELRMTQELVAKVLGVRRESIAAAARKLQAEGLIQCGRGRIRVLDRPMVEHASCACYSVVKQEFRRLLPNVLTNSVTRDLKPFRTKRGLKSDGAKNHLQRNGDEDARETQGL
jgi:CRP-like cAMP-binding protein